VSDLEERIEHYYKELELIDQRHKKRIAQINKEFSQQMFLIFLVLMSPIAIMSGRILLNYFLTGETQ